MNKRAWLLGGLAFYSGFVLMIFEMVAARLLAPSIGSTVFIWTSVIGVIIAALSTGYWLGGKIADIRGNSQDLAWLFLAAAGSIALCLVLYVPVLDWLADTDIDSRLKGVLASLILFAPASLCLGMISPYLAKLNVNSLKHSGQSIANLSALNSIGGISGTFLAGFVLFGLIGSRELLVVLIWSTIAVSWCILPRKRMLQRAAISIAILVLSLTSLPRTDGLYVDTATAQYRIADMHFSNQTIRAIATGPGGYQSGIDVNRPDKLVFWYTQQIAETIAHQNSHPQSILVMGGGTYTLPRHLADTYPDAQIDVVEIDPDLVGIARQYFAYDDPSNVHIIHQDARNYINTTAHTYDAIVVDVYGDSDVPFGFVTAEYGKSIQRRTTKNGIVVANIIAGQSGPCKAYLDASVRPYLDNYSKGIISQEDPGRLRGNIIAAFGDSLRPQQSYQPLADSQGPIYTDNFAPIEHLQQRCKDSDNLRQGDSNE